MTGDTGKESDATVEVEVRIAVRVSLQAAVVKAEVEVHLLRPRQARSFSNSCMSTTRRITGGCGS
jgi:hypothetical protein